MANSSADESKIRESPRADLNPLLNPVLEENLGRWAQVYFTNPPETRERAVMDLLRQLENRDPENNSAAAPSPDQSPVQFPDAVPCAVCGRENRPEQKYCGHCGTPMRRQPVASTANSEPELPSFLGLSNASQDESDLAALREKSFDSSYYEPDSHASRRILVAAALIIVLGGIAYFNWPMLRNQFAAWQTASLRASEHASPPASNPPRGEMKQPTLPDAATTASLPPAEKPLAETNHSRENQGVPAAPQPAMLAAASRKSDHQPDHQPDHQQVPAVTLASDSQASRPGAAGNQELLLAQRYLKAGSGPADSAQAARWLWKAVGKENSQAALLLADLYVRGDGVSKNCDEARILLVAAAKRGSSAAAQKLRTVDSSCR